MNKFNLILAGTMLISVACNNTKEGKKVQEGTLYGKEFTIDSSKVVTVDEIESKAGDKPTEMIVKGEVNSVCQTEGCWLTLSKSDGSQIMVRAKDHGFAMPKDIAGKKAYVNGVAKVKTLSVDEQKHLAEDAHKSKGAIDSITSPLTKVEIEANGVIVH